MLAAQEDQVDSAVSGDVDSAAALVAQVPVLALVTADPVVLAERRVPARLAVLAVLVSPAAEALVELLSRQSFSAAMARSTT